MEDGKGVGCLTAFGLGLVGIASRVFFLFFFSYFLLFLYFLFFGLLISGVSPVYIQGSRSMHDEEFWVLGHRV
jgi:hypothetical protein